MICLTKVVECLSLVVGQRERLDGAVVSFAGLTSQGEDGNISLSGPFLGIRLVDNHFIGTRSPFVPLIITKGAQILALIVNIGTI